MERQEIDKSQREGHGQIPEEPRGQSDAGWGRIKQLLRYPPAMVGFLLIFTLVMMALGADYLAPYGPDVSVGPSQQPPTWAHPFGTNEIGQDLLSRVIYGSRLSLGIGLLSMAVALVVGVPLGLFAGYIEGYTDFIIMRFIDLMMSFPGILLAILIMALAGKSRETVILAVGLINVPTLTRQTRAAVISTRQEEFILASRALGAGPVRIMVFRILPNAFGPIVVLATLGLGTAILQTAGLGFLGLGLDTDAVEWGTMIAQSQDYFLQSAWIPLAPGAAISMAVLGFNLVGDGLQDIMDPREVTET